ncbi:hypothetical protein ACHAWF_009562 [Thalassiosira exigua]
MAGNVFGESHRGEGGGRCPCANETETLSSLSDRRCRLPSGLDGIQLNLGGSCVPFSYGSSRCLQHDLAHDPLCRADDAAERLIPEYCFRPWCFVDAAICKRESYERVYRSKYFDSESGGDLFYSYTVCNSTAKDWFSVEPDVVGSTKLGGIALEVVVPSYKYPALFKRGDKGEVLTETGDEYYNESIPFEGAYMNYLEDIFDISNGDIRNISYTYRSKVSTRIHPTSSYTAAVQDIHDGLVDMAVGPFWITTERLQLTAFTIPIVIDKTFLVIPRPGTSNSLNEQIEKVLMPFSNELWALVIAIIVMAALLSVWFSDRSSEEAMARREREMGLHRNRSMPSLRRRKIAYLRISLDSILEKGLFFCSAGVEQVRGASLPNQLLMFGFGFFILITVSAYVANLAAFLTLSSTDAMTTMGGAVDAGYTICAHPALKIELETAWPRANFFYHSDGNEFHGLLDDFDAKKCQAMAVGWEDTAHDSIFLEKLCDKNLTFTDSIIAEMPIAFPISPQLSAGLSYWILEGERRHELSVSASKQDYDQAISCNVQFEKQMESSDYAQISSKNMFLPLVFFFSCAAIAVALQMIHQCLAKRGRGSLLGRTSTLNLISDVDQSQQNYIAGLIKRVSDIKQGERELLATLRTRKSDCNENDLTGDDNFDAGDNGDAHHRPVSTKTLIRSLMLYDMEEETSDVEDGSDGFADQDTALPQT